MNWRLDAYDLASVADAVDRFVDDLSNWYLRRGRRRFARAAEPADRRAAFRTLHTCLVTLARLVAPIMPHLAEEIYQNVVRSVDARAPESVHLTPYPVPDPAARDVEVEREMALAREVVTLGRAARNDAGIRVRQPLPSISIASEAADLSLSDELRAEVADELNVKAVLVASNVDAFARRVVKPNPRLLGPRLGAAFPGVSRLLQEGSYVINGDGSVAVDGHILSADEVRVTLQPLDNQAVAQDLQWQGGLAVALDRSVTPELAAEGLAREIIHRVQTMRKDAGLNVEDRIRLGYGASDHLRAVIEAHGERIREEVGAIDLSASEAPLPSPATDADGVFSWHGVMDDQEIMLALHRAS